MNPGISQSQSPTAEQKVKLLFSKLNLDGISNWPEKEQIDVRELIEEFRHIYSLDDMDLGKTSIVKHKIKLTNPEPF